MKGIVCILLVILSGLIMERRGWMANSTRGLERLPSYGELRK